MSPTTHFPLVRRYRKLSDRTVRECRLGFASASGVTFERSQSINIPEPSSVIRMFPALTSRCKICAFSYAEIWAVRNIQSGNPHNQLLPTHDRIPDHLTQLSGRLECVERLPESLQHKSVMHQRVNTRSTGTPFVS